MTGEILSGRGYLLSRHGALSFFLSLFSDKICPPDFFLLNSYISKRGLCPGFQRALL